MTVNEEVRHKAVRIPVEQFTTKDAWGMDKGQAAFRGMDAFVRDQAHTLFDLDLGGVERIDASCSREAIGNLIHKYRGSRCFFLSGVTNESNQENLDAAFLRSKMSVLHRLQTGGFKVLGLPVRDHLVETLSVVEKLGAATTNAVVKHIKGLGLPACNNRLRDLSDLGLVMRVEGSADSGGKEFVYMALR